MSSPKGHSFILAPRARRDVIAILQYTAVTWGDTQVSLYKERLLHAFETLSDNPLLGHHREGLPSTYRLYAVGSHIIVYRIEAKRCAVMRILHQRMSLPKHF